MYRFYVRHNYLIGKIRFIKVLYDTLCYLGRNIVIYGRICFYRAIFVIRYIVKRRNVYSLNSSCRFVKIRLFGIFSLVFHFDIETAKLGEHFLTLSDIEKVKERGNGFCVISTRPSAYDYGHIIASVFASERYFCKLQHIEDVSIAHFILKREAYHIKFCKRITALTRGKRDIVLPHFFLHIYPRVINTLTPYVLFPIEYAVKYTHAEIGHSYLISIGKAKRKARFDLGFILDYLSVFSARISSRL